MWLRRNDRKEDLKILGVNNAMKIEANSGQGCGP